MANWTLDTISWHAFDPDKVEPELISLVKAASLVEYNAGDYEFYLHKIFSQDDVFKGIISKWAEEERQHGLALKQWAEMVDPDFNFDESFRVFTEGFQLPLQVNTSVRGSQSGELIARCVVETGTSSYYTAIKEYTQEPVLKEICAKIAADELRHYKLFYDQLKLYLQKERMHFLTRFRIALGRILETEDDELAYAYYAAHHTQYKNYNRKIAAKAYASSACHFYRKDHVERMSSMIFKAIGLKPHGKFSQAINYIAWQLLRRRAAA